MNRLPPSPPSFLGMGDFKRTNFQENKLGGGGGGMQLFRVCVPNRKNTIYLKVIMSGGKSTSQYM